MNEWIVATMILVLATTAPSTAWAQPAPPDGKDAPLDEPQVTAAEPVPMVEPENAAGAPGVQGPSPAGGLGLGGSGRGFLMGGPGGPMGGGPGYEAAWYPSQSVAGQAADLGFVRQGLSFGAPVWRGEADMVMANLSVRNSLFATDAILPDSLRPFPDQLWNVQMGLNYMHPFANGWTGGLMGSIGSASDQPFHSIDELTANLGAFLRMPARNGRDSWQFMLMYMYGGPVNFPIPMVSYAWNPSDQLRINIGLPFSVAWQPNEDLTLNLSYMPLNNINARLAYRLTPRLQAFGGYEFLNESYFLADREVVQDRFFVFEQRALAGLRFEAWKHAAFELNAGYSFGRSYGEGDSQWGTLSDRVDVDPGPFAGINLRWRF